MIIGVQIIKYRIFQIDNLTAFSIFGILSVLRFSIAISAVSVCTNLGLWGGTETHLV